MDLGECPKVHDFGLRADYENAAKEKDYYYDVEAMDHLQAFIGDCDRRTESAKKRLAETQEELTAEVAEKANKVHKFSEEIGKKLAEAEKLGQAGEVEASMTLMSEIEELRAEKTKAEHEYRSAIPASSYQQQKLRVCEVCSAYLGIHDNDVRLADHFGGKLHLGFLEIREKLAELEKTAGPRKSELKKTGRDRDYEERRNKYNRYYVGGRELDRRSRIHRSRSRERAEKSSEKTTGAPRSRSRSRERRSEKSHRDYRRDGRDDRPRDRSRDRREKSYNSRDYRRDDRRHDDRRRSRDRR
ncbi:putative RNA-binding protein Luc7-like 2 isoform X2 [Culicoides brevitarsis]